jgi:ABC-2 type transport system permease protein
VAEPILRLLGLRKRFGGLAVTDDVSLDIAAGGIHAVIGPNGAGKTTLIHQVSGTLAPDAGRIVFAGQEVTGLSMALATTVLGLVVAWFALALFQSALIIGVGALLFGVDWGDPLAAVLLTTVFALVGAGAGILVGSLSRDADRVSAISPPVGIALGALGGCMVPLEVFPPVMLAVAHAVPQYWAMTAWQQLVFDGDGVGAIVVPLAVLTAFAVVLVGSAAAVLRRLLLSGA